jgi:CBS domain containing-hemolysin-like protein
MINKILQTLKRHGITLPTIINDETDLRKLVDQAGVRSIIVDSQREMIQSVLDLGETLVRELMVPRTDIVWIEGKSHSAPRIIAGTSLRIYPYSGHR